MIFEAVSQYVPSVLNEAYATTIADVITVATDDLTDTFWTVLPPILGVAVLVLAIFLSWRWLRRFVGGR